MKQVKINFQKYDGPGGKYRVAFRYKKKRPTKVVQTQKEGREWAAEEMERIDAELVRADVLMFSTASSDYLEDCDTWMQAQTVNEKFSHYKSFTQFVGQDIALLDVSIELCRKYYRRIQKDISTKTANNHIKNLKALWNWHRSEDRIASNPWRHVKKNKGEEHPEYIPSTEDVVAVLLAAQPWQQDYINIILKTGGRASDPRRLTWDAVNFEHEYLAFWSRKRKGGEKKYRKISMPKGSTLYDIIQRLWDNRDPRSRFVFTDPETGTGYTRSSDGFRHMLRDRKNNNKVVVVGLCSKAGVKNFTLKCLRHFVALRLDDSRKASLTDIQILLGHEKPTTTDEYLKKLRGDTKRASAILDDDDLLQGSNSAQSDTKSDTRGGLKRVK